MRRERWWRRLTREWGRGEAGSAVVEGRAPWRCRDSCGELMAVALLYGEGAAGRRRRRRAEAERSGSSTSGGAVLDARRGGGKGGRKSPRTRRETAGLKSGGDLVERRRARFNEPLRHRKGVFRCVVWGRRRQRKPSGSAALGCGARCAWLPPGMRPGSLVCRWHRHGLCHSFTRTYSDFRDANRDFSTMKMAQESGVRC